MRRLLLPLILGLIALGALAAASVHDLVAYGWLTTSGRLTVTQYSADGPLVPHTTGYYMVVVGRTAAEPLHSTISAAQWWRSTASLVIVVAVLALMVMALVSAVRHGAYAPGTRRPLRFAGLTALIGGPAAVLVAALAPRWAHGETASTTLWPQALIWLVVGAGLLAVRDLLTRAGTMQSELDGVI